MGFQNVKFQCMILYTWSYLAMCFLSAHEEIWSVPIQYWYLYNIANYSLEVFENKQRAGAWYKKLAEFRIRNSPEIVWYNLRTSMGQAWYKKIGRFFSSNYCYTLWLILGYGSVLWKVNPLPLEKQLDLWRAFISGKLGHPYEFIDVNLNPYMYETDSIK